MPHPDIELCDRHLNSSIVEALHICLEVLRKLAYDKMALESNAVDETLLLEVFVRLAVVDIALLVLELLHGFLLEDLIPALAFEFLRD